MRLPAGVAWGTGGPQLRQERPAGATQELERAISCSRMHACTVRGLLDTAAHRLVGGDGAAVAQGDTGKDLCGIPVAYLWSSWD